MFGSSTLEVAIGLIFVYLLLSLICSAANEIIATNSKRRAKILEKGILNLLTDPALDGKIREKYKAKERLLPKDPMLPETAPGAGKKVSKLERFRLWIRRLRDGVSKSYEDQGPTLGSIFYDHPLIKTLYQPRWYFIRERKPAYIPASTFTRSLLDILTPVELGEQNQLDAIRATVVQSLPENSSVRRSLLVFIDEAKSDPSNGGMAKLRDNIEEWFNKSMDRVSDWYKRRTQLTIFFLALGMVIILNADTVMIFKVLYQEPSVRAALLKEAGEYATAEAAAKRNLATQANTTETGDGAAARKPPELTAEQLEAQQAQALAKYQELLGSYKQLGIPLGWENIPAQTPRRPAWRAPNTDWKGWLLKIVGLFLTASAITLGAPFWFDILNRFISFRTAVKPPEATPQKMPELMSLTTPQRPIHETPTATPVPPKEPAPEPAEEPVEDGEGQDEPGG